MAVALQSPNEAQCAVKALETHCRRRGIVLLRYLLRIRAGARVRADMSFQFRRAETALVTNHTTVWVGTAETGVLVTLCAGDEALAAVRTLGIDSVQWRGVPCFALEWWVAAAEPSSICS